MKLVRIAALLIIALLSTMAVAEQQGFFFVQLADPQLGMAKGYDIGPEVEKFTEAVKAINRLKPAFVLISGDMTNQPHSPGQIRAFWKIVRQIDPSIPVHLVPGNHDLGTSTASAVAFYQRVYGPDRYRFSVGKTEFIVVDTTIICDPGPDPKLRDTQRVWLEEQLAAAAASKPDHIFVCTHHPWFVSSPVEKDSYDNVPTAQRKYYLALMDRYGVDYAFAGHLHYEAIAKAGKLTMIVDPSLGRALGKDPEGLNIVKVIGNKVEQRYYTLDKVPQSVTLNSALPAK